MLGGSTITCKYESKHLEKSAVAIYQVINRMEYFQGKSVGIQGNVKVNSKPVVLFEISRLGVR
jgi:hypothetical protein